VAFVLFVIHPADVVTSNQTMRWLLKPAIFLAALVPFSLLVRGVFTGNLGADPLAELTNETGVWTLRFLCITLLVTPFRRATGWNGAIRFRRMLGLFAFFYGTVHLLIFVIADRLASLGFPSILAWQTIRDLSASIGAEIFKRPYITVGFTAWVFMLALAATSTNGMVRRLGGKRWQALHRLIYGAAIAGVVHYWWSVKADVRNPLTYAVIVGALLSIRLWWWGRKRAAVLVRAERSRAPARPA
jgi:methionine sulfoxide reductase heme-binding subunit